MSWKMEVDFVFIWIFFISYVNSFTPSTTPSTTTEVFKRLMLISAGSGSYFNETWQLYSYNDPHGNKSDGFIEELIHGGEFKAFINLSWGEAEWVFIDYLNTLGDTIGQAQFYVPGYNITAQTTWMTSTFDQLLPLAISSQDASVTDRTSDKEVVVGNNNTNQAWMGILHTTTGLNPELVIASDVSVPFTTGQASTLISMGCKPVTTVSVLYKATDVSNMTIDNCATLCSGSPYQYIGLKMGNECYCVNITISNLYDDLPQYCTINCTGDSTQICGSSSVAYISVYNEKAVLGHIDSLTKSDNATLLTKTHDGPTTVITIDVTSEPSWSEDYMFVTGIKVTGENSTGQAVKYHIQHKYNPAEIPFVYKTSISGTTWIGLTGITYELETLMLRQLTVVFKAVTTSIIVDIIGPTGTLSNPGYVKADYLLVSAVYSPVTTTTSSTTVSTTTPTVSNVTSPLTSPTTPGSTTSTTPGLTTLHSTTTPLQTTSSTSTPTTTPSITTITATSPSTTIPTTSTTSSTSTSLASTSTSTTTTIPTTTTTTSSTSTSTTSTTTPTTTTISLTTSSITTPTTTSTSTSTSTTSTTTPTTTISSSSTTVTPATTSTSLPTTTIPSTTSTPSTTTVSPTSTTAALATTTSVSATTAVYSNYSILVNGVVYCPCSMLVTQNTTNSTVDIDAIIAELTLDEDSLSSNKRKYNSADDSRPSARTLGALGVIVITAVTASIVAMDSATLISEAKKIKKNYRYLKKQLSKRSLKVDDITTINNTIKRNDSLPDVVT